MRRHPSRSSAVLATAALLVVHGRAALAETKTEVFVLKYRSVEDAALLARPQCSDDARIQIEPKLRALTITDNPSSIERVRQLIQSIDLPPKNVDVTVLLVRGRKDPVPRPIADELRAVKDSVDPVMTYGDYETIARAQLSSVEGSPARVLMGDHDDYQVSFRIGVADARTGLVRFDDLALEKRKPGHPNEYTRLFQLTYQAQIGQKLMIGATSAANRETSVMLVLQVVIRGGADSSATVAGGGAK
ncbi:MAG: secretin N-terminal domain-containing protein [Acidobacteriota bacterium]